MAIVLSGLFSAPGRAAQPNHQPIQVAADPPLGAARGGSQFWRHVRPFCVRIRRYSGLAIQMTDAVKDLSDEDLQDLACYYSELPW
jgi:hypothetical protein